MVPWIPRNDYRKLQGSQGIPSPCHRHNTICISTAPKHNKPSCDYTIQNLWAGFWHDETKTWVCNSSPCGSQYHYINSRNLHNRSLIQVEGTSNNSIAFSIHTEHISSIAYGFHPWADWVWTIQPLRGEKITNHVNGESSQVRYQL